MRRALVLAFAVLVMACSSKAPSKIPGAPSRPPDESYETGGGLAFRVLIWKCDATNERVTMTQTCGEGLTGCGSWTIDRTLCPGPSDPAGREATRTASEREAESHGHEHNPIPAGYGWR